MIDEKPKICSQNANFQVQIEPMKNPEILKS